MDEHSLAAGALEGGGELGGSEEVTPVLGGDVGLTSVELRRSADLRAQSIAVVLAERRRHVGLAAGVDVGVVPVEDRADVAHLHEAPGAAVESVHPDVVLRETHPDAVMLLLALIALIAVVFVLEKRISAAELSGGGKGHGGDGDGEEESDHDLKQWMPINDTL